MISQFVPSYHELGDVLNQQPLTKVFENKYFFTLLTADTFVHQYYIQG